ncbi:MAG: DNA-binding protein [Rikenellaceae bacterium]
MEVITFEELRHIKDSLPHGSIERIAEELKLSSETVRNYFGGSHYKGGDSVGLHVEQGPHGGLVTLDDTQILNVAKRIIAECN